MNIRTLKSLDHPLVWWLCFAAGFAIVAASFSTDGSYDLENYHFYNGFAVFHERKGLDIAAGQLQTTLFYGLDSSYYVIFTSLNDHPVLINILLSIPYSLAALAIFLMARLFAKPSFLWPVVISAAAAVFGLTGAANLATLATTESDLVPGLAILIALAIWLTLERVHRNTAWTALGVGSLAGVSVGLKLTQAPLFIGMFLAVAVRFAIGKRSALSEAIAFGVGGLIAFAAIDGAWLWGNFTAYGNPIFPYMNNVFHSDLIAPEPWADLRFLPKTTLMALFYPAYWAFRPSGAVSELSMRDPRMLLGCVGALIVVLGFVWRWLRSRTAPPIGSFEISRLFVSDRVPRVLCSVGETLVDISLSCHPRESERSSGSRGSADPARNTRQAMADVRPVRTGRDRYLEDDGISMVAPRPSRSSGHLRSIAVPRAERDGPLSRFSALLLPCAVNADFGARNRRQQQSRSSRRLGQPLEHHRGGCPGSPRTIVGHRRSQQFPGRGRRLVGQSKAGSRRMRAADLQYGGRRARQDLQA